MKNYNFLFQPARRATNTWVTARSAEILTSAALISMTAARRRFVSTQRGAGGAVCLDTSWPLITRPALILTSVSLDQTQSVPRARTASTPRAVMSAVMPATRWLRTIRAALILTSVRTPQSVRIKTSNVSTRRGASPVSVFHSATMIVALETVCVTRENRPQCVRPATPALFSSRSNTGLSVRTR